MAEQAVRAGAGALVQRRFEPQHLHDGMWWCTGKSCTTKAAAIARAKTADPDHCNGEVIRVVEVVVTTESVQVWDAPIEGELDKLPDYGDLIPHG